MEETRRTIQNLLCALAAPFVVVVMVLLAIVAGLAYYLMALIQGFWSLFRDLPRWILNRKTKPPLRKPHFLDVPARSSGQPVD
jgi:Ni,Fe-hydrogenase I cytochrome b subunit